MEKLLIIGGSDAGISAALRAKEIAPDVEVVMALSDRYPDFSICGLSFFVSGMDLSYTPPLGRPWYPVQMAA